MKNPSLREQPREQHAPILASDQDASILGWLEGTGRLMDRGDDGNNPEEEDGEDINALISGDDKAFDDDMDDESDD